MINTNKGNMKTIKYKDKKYKLPFEVGLPEDPTTEEVVRNRFGGESCTLPAFAVAVYDVIMGSEQLATSHDRQVGEGHSPYWNDHRKGLDWFSRNFTKEYYVLLD